ncbi:unnamed protein product, partial [Meganyctiphanes norvegica]
MGTREIFRLLNALIVLMSLTSTFDVVTSSKKFGETGPAFGGGKTKQRDPVSDILDNAKKIDTKYHSDKHGHLEIKKTAHKKKLKNNELSQKELDLQDWEEFKKRYS